MTKRLRAKRWLPKRPPTSYYRTIKLSVVERTSARMVFEIAGTVSIKNPFDITHSGALPWVADVTPTILVCGAGLIAEGVESFPLAPSAVFAFLKRGQIVSVVLTAAYGTSEKLMADAITSDILSMQ